MAKIILVTGGARSGKSTFAEQLAERLGERVAYIATAEVWDREMADRVELHQRRRPASWQTHEAPNQAHLAIEQAACSCPVILFDCLTVYISNRLLEADENLPPQQIEAQVLTAVEKLLETAQTVTGTVIFVTNEVGDGIVPDNRLARQFRDLAGLANQRLAQAAAEVFWVVCGVPLEIKQLAYKLPERS